MLGAVIPNMPIAIAVCVILILSMELLAGVRPPTGASESERAGRGLDAWFARLWVQPGKNAVRFALAPTPRALPQPPPLTHRHPSPHSTPPGFTISPSAIPEPWKLVHLINPTAYAFRAAALNELTSDRWSSQPAPQSALAALPADVVAALTERAAARGGSAGAVPNLSDVLIEFLELELPSPNGPAGWVWWGVLVTFAIFLVCAAGTLAAFSLVGGGPVRTWGAWAGVRVRAPSVQAPRRAEGGCRCGGAGRGARTGTERACQCRAGARACTECAAAAPCMDYR